MKSAAAPFSEVEMATTMIAQLEGHGFNVRTEVPVTLDGQQVYADIIGCKGDESEGDRWIVVECKRVLCRELIVQCERWKAQANQVIACVREPRHRRPVHEKMREELAAKGIGLVYVNVRAAVATISIKARFNANAKIAVIVDAFNIAGTMRIPRHGDPYPEVLPGLGGIVDPPAGSAGGALRMTEKRTRWTAATEFLKRPENRGCAFSWVQIAGDPAVDMADTKPAQAAKAYRNREWLGVKQVTIGGIRMYEAKG